MCLTVNFRTKENLEKFAKGKIAKRDIHVEKVIRKDGYPPYYNSFIYEKGFEYYQTGKKFRITKQITDNLNIIHITRGLHSVKNLIYYINEFHYSVIGHDCVKMIIPKGATYYYHKGFYVSDRLIYV